ncbi:DUF4231 domain-containing protein [Nocardia sp. XZ_19_231]|uniref:DUF4231 domain-containing protein n=1 Tax=Nocardia sp. XZ_19_231 TaxID=2769252 RepID=UPI00188F1C14|nr:DUF4231 domain-containing protein [Nocardia sp. XZ_19_231]
MPEQIEASSTPDPASIVWERLEDQRQWYAKRSRYARRLYLLVKLAQIAVGAAVPVLAALEAPASVTAILAATVVFGEGAQQLFQWQVNWLTYRTTAEELKREGLLYLAEADPYTSAGRHRILAARIASITAQENRVWAAQSQTTHVTAPPEADGQGVAGDIESREK